MFNASVAAGLINQIPGQPINDMPAASCMQSTPGIADPSMHSTTTGIDPKNMLKAKVLPQAPV